MAALVEVRDLRCGYGRGVRRVEVVHGVSFDLDPGEFAWPSSEQTDAERPPRLKP